MFVLRKKGSASRIFGADPVKDGSLTLKDSLQMLETDERCAFKGRACTYAVVARPGCVWVLM